MAAEGARELLGLVPQQIHLSFEGAVGGLQQFLAFCGVLHLRTGAVGGGSDSRWAVEGMEVNWVHKTCAGVQ